ncbi:hypothetical protein A2U01_0060469, partial [Trifolium medium]|nr:hypothetical protein [Trifolium medium]
QDGDGRSLKFMREKLLLYGMPWSGLIAWDCITSNLKPIQRRWWTPSKHVQQECQSLEL